MIGDPTKKCLWPVTSKVKEPILIHIFSKGAFLAHLRLSVYYPISPFSFYYKCCNKRSSYLQRKQGNLPLLRVLHCQLVQSTQDVIHVLPVPHTINNELRGNHYVREVELHVLQVQLHLFRVGTAKGSSMKG